MAEFFQRPRKAHVRDSRRRRTRRRSMFSRRNFLGATLAGVTLARCTRSLKAAEREWTIGLGFSLYGMRALSLADAVKSCAEIGYDCVELPVMAEWPGDSAQL